MRGKVTFCFLRYFLARYLRYLLDKGIELLTVTLLSSVSTLTESPRLPVLFWTCNECKKTRLRVTALKCTP